MVPTVAPLRLCHITSGDLWAGAEIQLVTTAAYLIEQPSVHVCAVVFNEGRLARELRQLGILVTVLDESRLSAFAILRLLTRFLKEQQIEVLHTHKYKDGVLGTIAAKLAGVPHIVRTMHGMAEPMVGWNRLKDRVYDWLDRTTLKRAAELVIAVSAQMAETLRESGYRPTMVTCIHNGVNHRQVEAARSREDVRRELGIATDALVIGTAGRLAPVKGHVGLLLASKCILGTVPSAKFLVIGDGPLGNQLLSSAADLGVDEAFQFLGARSDVYDLMAAMDIFVLPSLSEGIPMALLEAMTLGTPVVAAAVGGIPEVIQHRANGLLVPSGDDRALAAACLELAKNPDLASALSAQARRTIAESFSQERCGESLLLAYRGIALLPGVRMGARS